MPLKRPLISVIIPTYKRPRQLERAVKSVLNQTYSNFELIVVNDSKEEEPIKKLVNGLGDKRIRYFRNQRKKGANGARNTGVINSFGRYITFLDDDDCFIKDRLQSCCEFMQNTGYGIICTSFYAKNYHKKKQILYPRPFISLENFLTEKSARVDSIMIDTSKISKNEFLWEEGLQRHQDTELLIRLLSKYKIYYLQKPLLISNEHEVEFTAKILEESKKLLFKKTSNILEQTKSSAKNYFYAIHYRELAIYFGYEKKIKMMGKYLRLSLRFKILKPKKYICFFLIVFKKIFHLS
ncbi:MAG: glycosyltransferase family 2 protein [Candidatus Omnitrophica bacterium]|nr:glycosyltransferase family 2 protein [Candidatus Omnitrophota bacterium]